MNRIIGIIPPIITPLLDNENVDEASLRNIVANCVEKGLHGIFVGGSGGETMALTQEQRNHAIRIVLDEAGNRLPVLCGAIDSSTRKVIENIKYIEQLGGSIAVVTPVFYTKTTSQGDIVRHFEEICKHTSLDIMIYNIPVNTQIHMSFDTINRISQLDKIIGLKDSSGNWSHFQKCLLSLPKRSNYSILQGATDIAGTSMLCGADGFIPIYSIFFPKLFTMLYKEATAGNIGRTLILQNIVNQISERITVRGHTVFGAKAIASAFGMGSSRLCEPYMTLTASEYDQLRRLALHYAKTIEQADDLTAPELYTELFDVGERMESCI